MVQGRLGQSFFLVSSQGETFTHPFFLIASLVSPKIASREKSSAPTSLHQGQTPSSPITTASAAALEERKGARTSDRWISRDPIEEQAGLNLYGYVLNSPIRYTDLLGLYGGPLTDPLSRKGSSSNTAGVKEVAGAVAAVGPVDAAQAAADAAKASEEARGTGLPGEHNGPQDAVRHCIWSCLMTQSIGSDQATAVGDNHETAGNRQGQPQCEEGMDQYNNSKGRDAGSSGSGNCTEMCMDTYTSGGLKNSQ